MKQPVHVLGGGGHAKEVIATLQSAGWNPVAVWDDDAGRAGTKVLGIPVRGSIRECPVGVMAVIAIGANRVRKNLANSLNLKFIAVIHPFAWVHASASIGAGAVVFAGAVVQPDSRIGSHVIINSSATVAHDAEIGSYSHVGPGVRLGGGVRIGEGAFLGVGVSVKPGVNIGDWAVAGAGAVVIRPVPSGVVVVGCPAMPLKGRTEGIA